MKRLSLFTMIILFFGVLFSCQQIFTYSPLSWAQRDPANLPDAQKIAYAEFLLASPKATTEDLVDMYNMIDALVDENPDDVDLQLLASDLALGGSGILDAIGEIDVDSFDGSAVEDMLAGIDLALVEASADHVVAAEAIDPEVISEEQYLNTGLILLAKAADEAGDFASLSTITISDSGWDTLVQADDYIYKGNGSISDYGVSNPNLPVH